MTPADLATMADHPGLRSMPTPVIVLDAAVVRRNIASAIRLLGGAHRWRPHIKTCRSPWLIELLCRHGVTRFKAATTAELHALAERGVPDVLVAFPAVGPRLSQVADLARRYPHTRVSMLADSVPRGAGDASDVVELFLDIDPGWHRTGIPLHDATDAARFAARLRENGWRVRGMHCYDGHLGDLPAGERAAAVAREMRAIGAAAGVLAEVIDGDAEIVLGGSATVTEVLAAPDLPDSVAPVTVGAGTLVINDARSETRLRGAGFGIAGAILTRVVSVPGAGRITTDAGFSAMQVDAGVPHGLVAGWPGLLPGRPSQEHLPLTVESGPTPDLGQLLVLVPRHFDSSVVQFDRVVVLDGDQPPRTEPLIGRSTSRCPEDLSTRRMP